MQNLSRSIKLKLLIWNYRTWLCLNLFYIVWIGTIQAESHHWSYHVKIYNLLWYAASMLVTNGGYQIQGWQVLDFGDGSSHFSHHYPPSLNISIVQQHLKSKCKDWYQLQVVNIGYIDVGDKWMLVTLSWWQFFNVSDGISILVTSFGCWYPTLMFKDRGCWWQKWPKPWPTSQSCPQHISSPTMSPT